ncbi:hypothetical protein T484DRAFT_2324459 [Baffinella frigidus]|nr:hypothetical protein T484DRAFT_2324459 [Cryptophyta sp. CCMP2293]
MGAAESLAVICCDTDDAKTHALGREDRVRKGVPGLKAPPPAYGPGEVSPGGYQRREVHFQAHSAVDSNAAVHAPQVGARPAAGAPRPLPKPAAHASPNARESQEGLLASRGGRGGTPTAFSDRNSVGSGTPGHPPASGSAGSPGSLLSGETATREEVDAAIDVFLGEGGSTRPAPSTFGAPSTLAPSTLAPSTLAPSTFCGSVNWPAGDGSNTLASEYDFSHPAPGPPVAGIG